MRIEKIKKLSIKLPIVLVLSFLFLVFGLSQMAHADVATDNALNYLRTQQDATGKMTTGFSAPSQWSAIAFAINGIDVATVVNPTVSLKTFLESDEPASPSAATDWEPRILAIVAIGGDPTNFGGVDYVANLESFYTNGQLGDECSLNDDIFGLLALIASGPEADDQIKQDTLNFIITNQDTTDGGFGFSAPGCAWYLTSADMTGAGLQALVEAKNYGLTHPDLDSAIDKAKAYLFANQNADGGFGYFGSSDTDTTGWVLQALNVSGLGTSDEANAARAYLLSQQDATDGGITAFDWGTSTFVSNASTTAQAIIALSGKGWIIDIFDPSASSSAIPTVTPTLTPSVTLTPTATPTPTSGPSNNSSSTPTPTPTLEASTTDVERLFSSPLAQSVEGEEESFFDDLAITPTGTVLGETDKTTYSKNVKAVFVAGVFAGLGLIFVFIYLAKPFIIRKFK